MISSPCPLHGPATADGTVAPRRVDTAPALAASAMSQPQQVISFADSLRLPLEEPLLRTAPRVRVSKDVDDWWVPRRSDRLAAKSAFRDPQPEKQAKRVLLNKWTRRPEETVATTPDAMIATKFHETFTVPLSSSKRAAMRELFPRRAGRSKAVLIWTSPSSKQRSPNECQSHSRLERAWPQQPDAAYCRQKHSRTAAGIDCLSAGVESRKFLCNHEP